MDTESYEENRKRVTINDKECQGSKISERLNIDPEASATASITKFMMNYEYSVSEFDQNARENCWCEKTSKLTVSERLKSISELLTFSRSSI